jgi:hypothetical protein
MLVTNGRVYIRSFNTSNAHAYPAAIIFDGSGASPTVYPWGLTREKYALQLTASGTWPATTGGATVTVRLGWKYAVCFKSLTGQYSSRSELVIPLSPSGEVVNDTGPLANVKPQMLIRAPYDGDLYADKAVIFRTMDGGGTYYFLEEIDCPASLSVTYTDEHGENGTTNRPKYDNQLDTSNIAPSPVSNLPPPCYANPNGDDYPTYLGGIPDTTSNMEAYAGRIWYFIGNRLYFSGNEEILNGVPEESFPAPHGIKGNYYVVKGQGRQLRRVRDALYYTTSNEVGWIRGTDRSTLTLNAIDTIGGAYKYTHASAAFRDIFFYLTADHQVAGVSYGNAPQIISKPLGTELRNAIAPIGAYYAARDVQFEVYVRDGNFWLVIAVINLLDPADTKIFVYDLERQIWFPPWKKPVYAITSGLYRENDANTYLIAAIQNGSTTATTVLHENEYKNHSTTFSGFATISAQAVPAGNHINDLRKRAHNPMLSYLVLERTKFDSDTEPTVSYRLDEITGAFTNVTAQPPPYLAQATTYRINWYPIQEVCQRVYMKLTLNNEERAFEAQNLGFVFQPEAGA